MISSLNWLERILAFVAGVALTSMMLLTFVDVIGRYWFNRSIFGATELIEYLMVLTIFGGLTLVTRHEEHITVSLFEGWLDRWSVIAQRWAVRIFCLLCQGIIAWSLSAMALRAFENGRRSVVLGLPQWLYPASAALICILGLLLVLHWLRGADGGGT